MSTQKATKPSIQSGGTMRRKPIRMSQEGLIEITEVSPDQHIPVMVRPTLDGIALATWASNNREAVESLLLKYRAILFRDFNVNSTAEFDNFIKATSTGQLLEYRDRSSPRHEVGDKIYTSTDYPADQKIFLHNEGTYWLTWPRKLYFCCLIAAEQGGETPIADVRRVYQRIDARLRERFIKHGWLLVRNYNDGFGLSWQEVFQTTERAAVEEHCHRHGIEWEWKEGQRLRTRQVRQAVARHPQSGELVWFNHAAFFHVTTLEASVRELLLEEFKEEELPHNTYYGDGTPIEASVLDELREAYRQERVLFSWQKGDVLLLDNMSVAHGRESFTGARKVVVGMAEPINRADI